MTRADFKGQFADSSRSLTWYLICRTAVVTFLLGGAAFLHFQGEEAQTSIVPLLILIVVAYLQAIVSSLLLQSVSNRYLFSQVQIVWDLLFVTALLLLSGGIDSVFPFSYLLVIVAASFLLSRRLTILSSLCAIILLGGTLDLQYFGYLDFIDLGRGNAAASTYLSTLFVHAFAFLLTALLSGTLAERWRFSERQLLKKNIDYEELEKLNRAILFQIPSGLMLLSPDGKVLSFNRSASEITGFSSGEVLGHNYRIFFSDFEVDFDPEAKLLSRSEFSQVRKSGENLILGYTITPVKGGQGEYLGVLVTFQDLTQIKQTEEELKRADRLAAIGRLSAGIAHEIRNPLASISGAVQLLLEGDGVKQEDQRIMKIVVKEAERLNALITNFLNFARPKPISKLPVNVCEMVQDLVLMLKADSRFSGVEIRVDIPADCTIHLDRALIVQSLWDLAINAAEALDGHGFIRISACAEGTNYIFVEDSGPGVVEDVEAKIFEPFFSTKEQGAGLGLASVYSVMEAHQGCLRISRGSLGGARFELQFGHEG